MKSRILFSIASTLIIPYFLNVLTPHAAFAEDQPVSCKADAGKTWYFAIGRTVFKSDTSIFLNNHPLISAANGQETLIPPNAKVPIGCEQNPQQLISFGLTYWPTGGEEKKAPTTRFDFIQLYRIWKNSKPQDYINDTNSISLQKARYCSKLKYSKTLSDGAVFCFSQPDGPEPLRGAQISGAGWKFIFSKSSYLTGSRKIILMSGESAFGTVDVTYPITSDILMHYNFDLPNKITTLDENYLIGVDSTLQKNIFSQIISNYKWPDQVNKNL